MRYEPVKVHFNNPICSYCFNICRASVKFKCLPIQAHNPIDWQKQAQARANHCSYGGLELTASEAETRWMNIKKADKCQYLMR